MRIIGLDVSATNVVACGLEAKPTSLKRFLNANKRSFLKLAPTHLGAQTLLAMQPDIVAMEPTGIHYSEFWRNILDLRGIEVRYVGHVQVRSYRKSQRLPDKNDQADALALACYCLEHLEEPEFFLRFSCVPAQQLRRLCLQLEHLNRIQHPIVCCARQYLAHEFPEVAMRQSTRKKPGDLPALWGWLAGIRPSPYFDRLWSKSVAQDFNLSISQFTQRQAARICDLESQQDSIEQEILQLMALSDFALYHKVFDSFGFGMRTRALLLSHIYPLADFLDADHKPVLELIEQVAKNKPLKRDRSLRAFKLRLGLGLVEDASGKSQKWIAGGSDLCRRALWRWCLTRIEPKGKRRWPSPIAQELGAYIDSLKAGGTPGQVAQSRCCARAATKLFKELVKELNTSSD